MSTVHLAYPNELIIDGKKRTPSGHCSISDNGRVTIRVNDTKSDGFFCTAGRTLGEDLKWRIWDAKKQEWVTEIPTVKCDVVGVNELADDLSGYTENEAEIISILEMKNATE